MKAIHIELPDKRVHVPMSEVGRQDFFLEAGDIDYGEVSSGSKPVNDAMKSWVLNKGGLTWRI